MGLGEIVQKIWNYRSLKKPRFDRRFDPLAMRIVGNLAYLGGADKALDYVSQNVDKHEGFAMAGSYALLGAGLWGINKAISYLNKKTKERQGRKLYYNKSVTALSWVKTGAFLAAIPAIYLGLNAPKALRNFRYDADRVISAFERPSPKITISKVIEDIMPEYPVKENGGPQYTGKLEGMRLGNLHSRYTGNEGIVPKVVNVDFNGLLSKLWEEKVKKSGNPVVNEMLARGQVADYMKNTRHTTITLDDYLRQIRKSIDEVNDNIDWQKVGNLKGLKKSELELVKAIALSLNENDLLSYALTELMPGNDGKKNIAVLDFLLRNAGREYVELIPALGDSFASMGPYQFTSYAVFVGQGERRGASIITLALPEDKRIPGSVIYLNGNDHHKAAYLFAIGNLAEMVNALGRKEFGVLENVWDKRKGDIVKYIATAHHLPRKAREAAQRWLDNNAKSPFNFSCEKSLLSYAEKTDSNFRALYGIEEAAKAPQKSPKSPVAANAPFDYEREISNKVHLYSRTIQDGDTASKIARQFNEWKHERGLDYRDRSFLHIVNSEGRHVGDSLQQGKKVYILAAK